jgi:hypothetical protein
LLKKELEEKKNKFVERSFNFKILDYFLIVYSIFLIVITCLRAISSMGSPWKYANYWLSIEPNLIDPNVYGQMQALTYFFYLVPFLIFTINALYTNENNIWLLKFSTLMFGAITQGQFAFIGIFYFYNISGSSLFNLSSNPEKTFKLPSNYFYFWFINLSLFIYSLILFLRVYYYPFHFTKKNKD